MNTSASPHFAAYYRWLVISRHLGLRVQAQADSLLDVGCDDGYFLSRQSGPLKVGIDLKPEVMPDDEMAIVQADGCALPFPDESFAAVFALDVIEHIVDDTLFLSSITRVLAKSGNLWLSTPTDTADIFPSFLTRRATQSWGHERAGYSAEELAARFPNHYDVEILIWNATSLRLLFVPLRLLRVLSPFLSRLVARLCFEIDRRLPEGRDHIFLQATRKT